MGASYGPQEDRIAKIFGCSQFVILRAYQNGYHMVGDALLSGVMVENMESFDEDEVECLQVL
jgi:hypothetical protein